MKTFRILILLGIILFAVSFYLVAVREAGASQGDSGMHGYTCAYVTLLAPWGSDGMRMLREGPLEYFAVLISGWINPLFGITAIVLFLWPQARLGSVLRVVVIVMFLTCWMVFYKEHLHPREGYFLWTGAMLLVLFANKLAPPAA